MVDCVHSILEVEFLQSYFKVYVAAVVDIFSNHGFLQQLKELSTSLSLTYSLIYISKLYFRRET